jgi:hypothetical protein
MKFERITGCGELGIEFKGISGLGEKVTKEFLSELIEKVVRQMVKYYDDTGDYVFAYGEKQLHSVICPSIAGITSGFVMEHPLERKPPGEQKYTGHVDYWLSHRKISYLIELKHAYLAIARDIPRKSIATKLSRAIRQLKDVPESERMFLSEYNKTLVEIALEVVTFFRSSESTKKVDDIKTGAIKDAFKNMTGYPSIQRKLNMQSLWLLDRKKVKPIEFANYAQIYPAVAFIGSIFPGKV